MAHVTLNTIQIVLMAHYKNLLIQIMHMAHICEDDMIQIKDLRPEGHSHTSPQIIPKIGQKGG